MMKIQAGSFVMGDALDGTSLPHTVWVDAFTCEENLVTFGLWAKVAALARVEYGYSDLTPGKGKAEQHPVHSVSFRQAIKWCNGRSEVEGLPPCYTSGETGEVYRWGDTDNVRCAWDVPGYRLLTEAEWEKMARGGLDKKRFPSGDELSQKVANYRGQTYWPYDKGPSGYNQKFAVDPKPYTSPVGSFAPNAFGAFDLAGNLQEWCWDWYDLGYYKVSPQKDPRGPDTGTVRVQRGGAWNSYATDCRVAVRLSANPGTAGNYIGFRCVQNRI